LKHEEEDLKKQDEGILSRVIAILNKKKFVHQTDHGDIVFRLSFNKRTFLRLHTMMRTEKGKQDWCWQLPCMQLIVTNSVFEYFPMQEVPKQLNLSLPYSLYQLSFISEYECQQNARLNRQDLPPFPSLTEEDKSGWDAFAAFVNTIVEFNSQNQSNNLDTRGSSSVFLRGEDTPTDEMEEDETIYLQGKGNKL